MVFTARILSGEVTMYHPRTRPRGPPLALDRHEGRMLSRREQQRHDGVTLFDVVHHTCIVLSNVVRPTPQNW